MSRRRLTGIAAMSAAALASASLGGPAFAADESDDSESQPGLTELRALMEAFGGGEVPDEVLEQVLATYEAMGIDPSLIFGMADPQLLASLAEGDGAEDAFIKLMAGAAGSEDGEDFLSKWITDASGGDGTEEAFLKMIADATGEDSESPFVKLILENAGLDEAAFPKVEELVGDPEEAFVKVDTPIAVAENALIQAAAQGDIDAATLQAILELLPEE